jgi:tight adherence protein B
MPLAVAVFVSVFLVTALLIAASGVNASERGKQTLARLNDLLAAHGGAKDETVDVRKRETLSSIPLLNRILLRLEIAPELRQLFHQANVDWTPDGFLLASLALWMLGACLLYLRTGTLLFSLAAGLIAAFGPLIYVTRKRARRLLKFEEGLPAALDLMVSGLRGGHSFVSVLGLVAREASDPIGPEFRICFDEQNYGLELRTALQNLAARVPVQDIRIVITAVMVQKETGGNLAEVLEKCGHVIRERFRLKQEVRVKTAQGRLTGWILSLLPPGLAAMLYLLRPDVISLLWLRPLGVKMIYTGVVMVSIGALLIRKIVNIRV